jgi:HIRAN domain
MSDHRTAPAVVDVVAEERYWYPDDGSVLWVAGFQPVDAASGRYLANDAAELTDRGLRVAPVAGAGRHHADDLQADAFAPGRPLELRRRPDNPHDRNAIAVLDAGGTRQAGWVPRELAERLAPQLDAGERWSAVALRERRADPRSPRIGLTMLLAPAASIELRPTKR